MVAKQITGHLTDSMYDRYNIVSEKDLRQAGAKGRCSFRVENG